MERNMFGVVLWSDPTDRKAVIWCEDQGDLAFYRHTDVTQNLTLEAGDWVQFDLEMQRQQRFACNPRLIQGGACRSLPDMLMAAGTEASTREADAENADMHPQAHTAQIIPFAATNRAVVPEVVLNKACRA
ncbi:hypothetical protein TRL7639_01739 [Falsiruegeria litorea R37]|uniref:Uncharacterized protein n=1 Tax=Falsiruegeria litorea R37 TaxID=1200284 RepID=A0A1Y5SAG4_9RHOB|nr:hypothetical protein [Falsiruegeria litorea]SLN36186.1 hypothetical protein TRL7639_01739 [Falsiruegeria litorea R37]